MHDQSYNIDKYIMLVTQDNQPLTQDKIKVLSDHCEKHEAVSCISEFSIIDL